MLVKKNPASAPRPDQNTIFFITPEGALPEGFISRRIGLRHERVSNWPLHIKRGTRASCHRVRRNTTNFCRSKQTPKQAHN